MTQHTQGRIRYAGQGDMVMESSGEEVATAYLYTDGRHDDIGRRMVACWNACEGISTETLELVHIVDTIKAKYAVEKQRLELLALLNGILKCERGMLGHLFLEGWQEQVIRDTIAKHQPTTAGEGPATPT